MVPCLGASFQPPSLLMQRVMTLGVCFVLFLFLLSHYIFIFVPRCYSAQKLKVQLGKHCICVASRGNHFPKRSSVTWLVVPSREGSFQGAKGSNLLCLEKHLSQRWWLIIPNWLLSAELPRRLAGSAQCRNLPSSLKTRIPTEPAWSYFLFKETEIIVICGVLSSRWYFPVVLNASY